MSMSLHDVTATSPTGTPASTDADRARVRVLAEQFESMLLAQMLREMKQAMSPEADEQGLGGAILGDAITTELAQALGRTGSLGLSELVATAFARDGAGAAPPAAEVTEVSARAAVALEAARLPALPMPEGAAAATSVTSQYGWRVDPLHGQHRFHGGVDLRAAYGEDVRAATDGTVTFAGEKPGYGLVVVVSHATGLETRYAHLSATSVAAGDRVEAGSVIARSGQSGRATGPHLHFEVRQDGRPVDPGRVAGLLPVVGAGWGAGE